MFAFLGDVGGKRVSFLAGKEGDHASGQLARAIGGDIGPAERLVIVEHETLRAGQSAASSLSDLMGLSGVESRDRHPPR